MCEMCYVWEMLCMILWTNVRITEVEELSAKSIFAGVQKNSMVFHRD